MSEFEFSVKAGRFGRDHVTVSFPAGSDVVTFSRDARDVESVWHLERALWSAFLDQIGQPEAASVVNGVRHAVVAGEARTVMRAVSELASLQFAEIDWHLGFGQPD